MPCYDPPPPWEGAARRSGEEAAQILCAMIGKSLNHGGLPSEDLLRWYLGHRNIDLLMARGGGYFQPQPGKAEAIEADIARIKKLLQSGE